MSIGTAFHSAGTGLAASARLAETVSNNVANAMTEGYARRSTELSSSPLGGYGGGVRIVGTVRAESAQITSERRLMDAARGAAVTLGDARDRALKAIGEPGERGSLAARATALETTLIAAAATPSSSTKLTQVLDAAKSLIGAIAGASEEAAAMRTDAEADIEHQVGLVNQALRDVDALNTKIRLGTTQGVETSSLEDERSRVIDRITEILPVRTVKREGGEVALYTQAGGALLDGRVWELSFSRTAPAIAPGTPGPLNGLYQDRGNGLEPAATSGSSGLFGGGSLAASFEVRDSVATEMLGELDLYAQDLVTRFRSPPLPAAWLDGGGEGLFVDTGAGGVGLSARLAVNPAADPAAGGEMRRLRDGLSSIAAGPVGFGDYLQSMVDAMTEPRNPGGMVSTGANASSAGLAGELGAFAGARAAQADDTRAYLASQSAILGEREAGELGVDTDAELQFLMLVEQSYAANARVLTVIDSLMQQLLEI